MKPEGDCSVKNLLANDKLSLSRATARELWTVIAIIGAVLAGSSLVLSPYMVTAICSYLCLCAGIVKRRTRKLHAGLMASGIAIDLLLVIVLEVKKDAIKTALSFSLLPLQQLHIATSSVATVLYFPVLILGGVRLLRKGGPKVALFHVRLGILAFLFRSLGFLLMFSLIWK